MKRYNNGELVTKSRIQDEEWYGSYYQPFLEFTSGSYTDVDMMYEETIRFFKDTFDEELTDENKSRILRWCVLHVERMCHGNRDNSDSNTTDLETLENKIIECLNEADDKLNNDDFSKLSESIIDYIDEIGRNKR